MAKILITTDDRESAARLQQVFEAQDEVRFVSGPSDALSELDTAEEDGVAVVVTGGVSEGRTRELINAVANELPFIPIVALVEDREASPTGTIAELRPDQHFVKPVDPDEVALVVHRLISRKRLQAELGMVGKAAAIQEVVEQVAQIAPVGTTVLITGESGTGKELVARGLHRLSPRRGKPFIAVNIAALPETLLESELFGHEKGAFTGASSLRKGMFELADGGTIFLDEIAEMPSGPQTRLLRVLEEREFMRVGGSDSIRVDVRVIAATNQDLRQAVELNEFRRDLYYRLNVLHIHLPALRERREDIPLLVHEFIRELSQEHQREFRGIAPDAMEILAQYDWPGNVRELRNLIESMVVLAPGSIIRSGDIPPEVRRGTRQTLPAHVGPSQALTHGGEAPVEAGAAGRYPEMELIFRTLVDLKFDVEDLRREFEAYKRRHPELMEAQETRFVEVPRSVEGAERDMRGLEELAAESTDGPRRDQAEGDEVIEFRPGMTMQDLERAAIIATLRSVDGNRRRASEKLGIGERTLYRKLREYDIDV